MAIYQREAVYRYVLSDKCSRYITNSRMLHCKGAIFSSSLHVNRHRVDKELVALFPYRLQPAGTYVGGPSCPVWVSGVHASFFHKLPWKDPQPYVQH